MVSLVDVGDDGIVKSRGPWKEVAEHGKGEGVGVGVACSAEGEVCLIFYVILPGLGGECE